MYGGIFLPPLSDNHVDMLDVYVVLSDVYVDLSDLNVDLPVIHLLTNTCKSKNLCYCPVRSYR